MYHEVKKRYDVTANNEVFAKCHLWINTVVSSGDICLLERHWNHLNYKEIIGKIMQSSVAGLLSKENGCYKMYLHVAAVALHHCSTGW